MANSVLNVTLQTKGIKKMADYEISLGVFKYVRQRFDQLFDRPAIIVFNEKHDTRYFLAQNSTEAAAVFFQVLNERVTSGYWYHFESEVGEVQGKFGVFRDKGTSDVFYKAHEDVTKLKSETTLMEELLATHLDDPLKAGLLAYQFLNIQSQENAEYEIFNIEHPEKVDA